MKDLTNCFSLPTDKTVTSKSERWSRFKKYWTRQWRGACISVYKIVNRTNNFAESLNKSINGLIGARRPHIWKLIERLNLLDLDYSNQITKADDGKIYKKHMSKITSALNELIENATDVFNKKKDVQRFLKNVTYDIRLELMLKDRLNVNQDILEDDYEEIIPNNFNPSTNFEEASRDSKSKDSKRKMNGPCEQLKQAKKRKINESREQGTKSNVNESREPNLKKAKKTNMSTSVNPSKHKQIKCKSHGKQK